MSKTMVRSALALLAALLGSIVGEIQTGSTAHGKPPKSFEKVVFGCLSGDLAKFEAFARQCKRLGATHVVLTAEDLPWARWQYDTPGDPYPSWAISNVGILKISTPEALREYIPQDYANKVMKILEARCKVLRELGLKAAYTTFEPQMLPKEVFQDHPLWRGPQVDHPMRSRVPRFAPCIDHPEVLNLYRESMRKLAEKCPEVEIISLHTNDSGSGMSWSGGLYAGSNGSSLFRHREMHQRYHDFFAALLDGAAQAGVERLEIETAFAREKDPSLLASKLTRGMAIANREGPDARPYKATAGFLWDFSYPYYPVSGIPVAVRFAEELEKGHTSSAPRLFVLIRDWHNKALYLRLYEKFQEKPTHGSIERLAMLKELAAEQVGSAHAGSLLEAWITLNKVQEDIQILQTGGTILYLGCVQQRWLTRPFVPFPEELTPQEKSYYRRYQFQARSEKRADNLVELQGTHAFAGLGAKVAAGNLLSRIKRNARQAREGIEEFLPEVGADKRQALELLVTRLKVLDCLVNNCRNVIDYQYFLDVIKEWKLRRDIELEYSLKAIWEWREIRNVARQEVDNSAVLIDLLESASEPLLHVAPKKNEEDIRILGPDLTDQLRKKMKIMLAHWEDYERLFMKD